MAEMAAVNNERTGKQRDYQNVTHHNLPQGNTSKDSFFTFHIMGVNTHKHTHTHSQMIKKRKKSAVARLSSGVLVWPPAASKFEQKETSAGVRRREEAAAS